MSATPPLATVRPAMPGRRRVVLAVLFLASAGVFGFAYARDVMARRDVLSALGSTGMLRPADGVAETIAAFSTADQAAAFAAETILERAPASGPAAAPATARGLAAEALASRPGSSHYLLSAGRAALAEWGAAGEARRSSVEAWKKALELASAAAPGLSVTATALGGALLDAWPSLSEAERAQARKALSRAFRSPEFVRRSLPLAMTRLGPDALRLLPDVPEALRAAAAVVRVSGDEAAASALDARADGLGAAPPNR